MHEMGIAYSVLTAARTEAARHPGQAPLKVGVRIGELAALDPEALRFCFAAITRDTDMESLQLEIEVCPFRFQCRDCGTQFVVRDFDCQCPQCGGMNTECISGQELEVAYLEVEEYAENTAGTKSTQ
jgi:hydrogenase nickel incorporation protein HypA/HybF